MTSDDTLRNMEIKTNALAPELLHKRASSLAGFANALLLLVMRSLAWAALGGCRTGRTGFQLALLSNLGLLITRRHALFEQCGNRARSRIVRSASNRTVFARGGRGCCPIVGVQLCR